MVDVFIISFLHAITNLFVTRFFEFTTISHLLSHSQLHELGLHTYPFSQELQITDVLSSH